MSLRPDGRRQPIMRSIAAIDHLVNGLEFEDVHHRPEDLLLGDLHVIGDVGEQRRLDEVTLLAEALAAGQALSAFLLAGVNVTACMRSICSCDTCGPCVVSGSNGSPSFCCLAFSAIVSTSLSWIFSSTKRRLPAQQHWPWLKNKPRYAPSTAASRSASAKTMFGDFAAEFEADALEVRSGPPRS